MLEKLANFIQQHQLFNFSDQLAIAVSGGKDSVSAAHALEELGYTFVIVHCDFQLRGAESDGDEIFVKKLANDLKHCNGYFSKSFNTKDFAQKHKLSIQEAARQLRYDYFEKLHDQNEFDYLITAHHADDELETFMINLQRGSGLKGLKSIPVKRDFYRRPMLSLRSADILQFTIDHAITYREDSSNKSDHYLRNLLRNKLIPQLNENIPNFSKGAIDSISNLQREYELFNALIQQQSKEIIDHNGEALIVDIEKITTYPQAAVFLYNILEPYHFNYDHSVQIIESFSTGKEFRSSTHNALINRGKLEIRPKLENFIEDELNILGEGSYSLANSTITLREIDPADVDFSIAHIEYADAEKLQFPLTLRKWQQTDRMRPLGLEGSKLVSDLMIDAKLSRHEKEQITLLSDGSEIVWLEGFRISDKVKITFNTQRVFAISYSKS